MSRRKTLKTGAILTKIQNYVLTRPPHIRAGQAAFNALHSIRPDIADKICGTPIDPFHKDRVLPDFYRRVTELLDKDS